VTRADEPRLLAAATGEMTDLGALAGVGSSRAVDVNAQGQIAGYFENSPLGDRAVLWSIEET
jgi:uncharacterized membrane protein